MLAISGGGGRSYKSRAAQGLEVRARGPLHFLSQRSLSAVIQVQEGLFVSAN